MRAVYLLLLLCGCNTLLGNKKPNWVDPEKRTSQYPERVYFTGYASHVGSILDEDGKKKLNESAVYQLAIQIKAEVISETKRIIKESGNLAEDYYDVKLNIFTSASIPGLSLKHYYDDRKLEYHVLAVLDKMEYSQILLKSIVDNLNSLNYIINNMTNGNPEKVSMMYKLYSMVKTIYDRVFSDHLDLYAFDKEKAESLSGQIFEVNKFILELKRKLDNIKAKSYSDIYDIMRYQYSEIIDSIQYYNIIIKPIYYTGTFISSPFAENVRNYLQDKLTPLLRQSRSPVFVLEGRIDKQNDVISIDLFLYRLKDTDKIHRASINIENEFAQNNGESISLDEIRKRQWERKNVETSEIEDLNLSLEIWTDKGSRGIVLTQGDYFKLYARTKRAGYLRILNRMQNDMLVLIEGFKNYYISEDLANKVIEIGEIEAIPPFGNELLIAYFSTEKLPEIKVEKRIINGIIYSVVTDTLGKVVDNVRGLRNREKKEISESSLWVTTVPNQPER